MTTSVKAPVLLFTYRKPQFLDEIIKVVTAYSPPRLYVISNQAACKEERSVVESIRKKIKSWNLPFDIVHLFHKEHLLINDSIHFGIDHVLNIEESAIILEDDTVPSISFFTFCNSMLSLYQDENNVGSIIGCNLGAGDGRDIGYRVPFAFFYWGWATWAKKWRSLRGTPLPWGEKRNGVSEKLQDPNSMLIPFLERLDDRCTWDVRWGWQQALHNMDSIIASNNLVNNKGFVKEGSYIRFNSSRFADIQAKDSLKTITKVKLCRTLSYKYEKASAALLSEILSYRGELELYTNEK